MEVINNLLNFENMKIYQNTDWFNFSLDSILLANFINFNKKEKRIIDFGTGNAPIPMILSKKTNCDIYGVEIQKEIYELAEKSVKKNGLENKIKLINDDIKNVVDLFGYNSFDMVICNPPFFKVSKNSNLTKNKIKQIARHEILITLEEIIFYASKVLIDKGKIYIVHRPSRMSEIFYEMKKNNIEPKRIQLIFPKKNYECNMILIEGVKFANSGLKILPPLYVHNDDGNYTKIIKSMFN